MEGLVCKARLCRRYGSDTGLASSIVDDLLAMKGA
jgi:geranylgeranyl pyrophosphate synthase